MADDRDNAPDIYRILDAVAMGLFSVDRDCRITYMNREAERISGFTNAQALGCSCREVFNTDRCLSRCHMKKAMDQGRGTVKVRLSLLNRLNRRIPVEVTAAVLRDATGRVVGGVESMLDLTARRVLEKEARQDYMYADMVGRDESMRRLLETARVVASTETTVLLQGETGTGKDLLARVLHNMSRRAQGPFVKINCAAVPDNLLESELFGYRKGAFTDATSDKAGLLTVAARGTVYLDEVAQLPPALQAKLLQALEDRKFYALGSTTATNMEARVIAATNSDLGEMVREGSFRADLYYRLRVVQLDLPPLRERASDIPPLVDHFVAELSARYSKNVHDVEPEAMTLLLNHDYPGNVRELRHIIEHGVIISSSGLIGPDDLPRHLFAASSGAKDRGAAASRGPSGPVEADGAAPPQGSAPGNLASGEREVLLAALADNQWRVAETAESLGIHRTTLWRKMKRHGLQRPQPDVA